MRLILFGFFIIFTVNSFATSNKIFLYEYEKRDSIDWTAKPLLPRRVYLIQERGLGGWSIVKTDDRGKFPVPLEVYQTGSVVSGTEIGARKGLHRFELTGDKGFVPTKKGQYTRMLVLSDPPVLRQVGLADLKLSKAIRPVN